MKWYYADNGRQVGPVEEAALDDLVRAGAVRDDTLVWSEGMANWQPHATVRGPKQAVPMPTPPLAGAETSYCSECGRPYPSDQLVMVGNASVCALCKPIYLQRLREGGQAVGARRYAGFWIRFVARLIDGILLAVVGFIIRIPFMAMVPLSPGGLGTPGGISMLAGFAGVSLLLQLAVGVAYEVYFLTTKGATLGKQALGLKVIRSDGSGIPTGLAVGRYFCQYINMFTLFIGYIMAGFDSEKRGLHDRICDTRVIYVK